VQGTGSTAPRLLGRYALYEKIASGGMASVHLGRLLGPVGFARTVAIKRMHPQFAEDPEFVSMFLDEARLAARIRHPNVVPTLDVVAVEGELFLVMDFVQGESLARLIRAAATRGERMPPGIVASIVVGLLQGLHAAHEATSDRGEPLEIVHRDVSPHNVLVGTDGVARVLDFGVAKAVGRSQTTREGQLKGKLAYMSPEQVRGNVSRATDVYASSVVLWEALTGKRLFQGENEAQVLDRVLRGTTSPPSMYASDLPPGLDAVVMRGLDTDAARRFSTARDMARALEEIIPLASSSKVGDWVQDAAKDTLSARSVRVATIESDSAIRGPGPAGQPSPASTDNDPTLIADDMVVTQLSSGSASSPLAPDRTRSRTMWLVVGGASGGLVLAAVLGLTLSHRTEGASISTASTPPGSGEASVAASTPPAVPKPSAVQSSAASPPPPALLPSASAVIELPASSPPAAANEGPATGSAHPVVPRGTPHAEPVVKPAAPSSCTPPWYFDTRGVRVFKTECL